jgi:hypothetical protein
MAGVPRSRTVDDCLGIGGSSARTVESRRARLGNIDETTEKVRRDVGDGVVIDRNRRVILENAAGILVRRADFRRA